jgi:hypothetical protein
MSVTSNFRSSANACRCERSCTSSKRSPNRPMPCSATAIVITGPMTVSRIAT